MVARASSHGELQAKGTEGMQFTLSHARSCSLFLLSAPFCPTHSHPHHHHHAHAHNTRSHTQHNTTQTQQTESKFAKAYESGLHKSKYWEPFFEDSLDLIAKLPTIAAMIYRRTYKGGDYIAPDPKLDWAANLSHMMGYDDPNALELMRLYQTIHSDHEGGNVSAHATHLVGSALSDPYLSFAAGMCGLAGPLHGLANQEVLRWLQDVVAEVRFGEGWGGVAWGGVGVREGSSHGGRTQ